MPTYRVVGASRETGDQYNEFIDAMTPDDAERYAQEHDVLVTRVVEIEQAAPPVTGVAASPRFLRRIPAYSTIEFVAQIYLAMAILFAGVGALAAIAIFVDEKLLWGFITIGVTLVSTVIPLFCSEMLRCVRDMAINSWHIRHSLEGRE